MICEILFIFIISHSTIKYFFFFLDQLQAFAYTIIRPTYCPGSVIVDHKFKMQTDYTSCADLTRRTASAVDWASSMKASLLNNSSRVLLVIGDSSRWVRKRREMKINSPDPAPNKCQRRRHVHSRNSCFLLGGRAIHHFLMLLETERHAWNLNQSS